jgi:hypothetical protein
MTKQRTEIIIAVASIKITDATLTSSTNTTPRYPLEKAFVRREHAISFVERQLQELQQAVNIPSLQLQNSTTSSNVLISALVNCNTGTTVAEGSIRPMELAF